jgi:predicted kinase
MSNLKATICVGASGSGKSTYAKELCKDSSWVNIERDIIREFIMTTQFHHPSSGNFVMVDNLYRHWKYKNEPLVNGEFDLNILRAVNNQLNVCISDTNLSKDRRDTLKLKLEALGYEVEIKVFGLDLTFEELCKRDLYRKNSVGREVIWKQFKKFNTEFGIQPLEFNTHIAQPKRFLVDLDGTLAIHTSGRNAYEWDRVEEDTVNEVVKAMMEGIMNMTGRPMPIFMSGRDSICREGTVNWLESNTNLSRDWINENLYMRVEEDMRPDTIVKEELIKHNQLDKKYNIICALDDRKKVIRHYHLLGIYVIDCGIPMDEF